MDPYTDHERPYGHTGTKCPSVAELGVLHAKLGKKTYTSHVRVLGNVYGPRTAGTVTREKLRKTAGTRAMENWAKRRTMHVRVHGPVHGPKTAGTVTREFFCRTSVSEGAARATWKTGQNDVLGTYAYMDPCTDQKRPVP